MPALIPGRHVVVSAYGDDPMHAVANHLRIEAQPVPERSTLAKTDVLVAVKAAAVGWVDLLMTSGQYQHMPNPPYTPGLEYSGVVAWVGEAVTRWKVGDRVLADGFKTGPRSSGHHRQWGGFASWSVAPEHGLMALPDDWSFGQGCNLLGNYETAYHCLIARGRLKEGETVLIHGASGSTGLAAVHVAKMQGATVIATGRSRDKLDIVQAQGADHVIQATNTDGEQGAHRFRDEVKRLTDGLGVHVVYDGVGGPITVESMRCMRFGGRLLIVGWAATPFVAKGGGKRGAPNANQLPTNRIMMKGLDVLGCPTVISTVMDPSIRQERKDWIEHQIVGGELCPYVGAEYAFTDVREAMEAKWRSKHVGGCVLRVGDANDTDGHPPG